MVFDIISTYAAAVRAVRVAVSTDTDMMIRFPLSSDLQNFSLPSGVMDPASITIPAALLRERATGGVHV